MIVFRYPMFHYTLKQWKGIFLFVGAPSNSWQLKEKK